MSRQDESVMRALSKDINIDNGTSCATCREMRRENKMNCCSHGARLHRY